MSGTTLARADPPEVPAGYRVEQRMRIWPLIVGPTVFGVYYGCVSLVAAHQGSASESGSLLIPGVGPFLAMRKTDNVFGTMLLASDGVGQLIGLGITAYGLVSRKTVLVRDDRVKPKPRVLPVPVVGSTVTGLALAGTF